MVRGHRRRATRGFDETSTRSFERSDELALDGEPYPKRDRHRDARRGPQFGGPRLATTIVYLLAGPSSASGEQEGQQLSLLSTTTTYGVSNGLRGGGGVNAVEDLSKVSVEGGILGILAKDESLSVLFVSTDTVVGG